MSAMTEGGAWVLHSDPSRGKTMMRAAAGMSAESQNKTPLNLGPLKPRTQTKDSRLKFSAGQSLTELLKLETSVTSALTGGEGDSEYWEAVLRRLQMHKAKVSAGGHLNSLPCFGRRVQGCWCLGAQEAARA